MPQYKCKSIAALDIALGGLPAKMKVEADVGTGVSAKTVGELRKVTTSPPPMVRYPSLSLRQWGAGRATNHHVRSVRLGSAKLTQVVARLAC
jgi:hypothetical protein